MLGILPGVREGLALTESLISGGCAVHCIFLMVPHESSGGPLLQHSGLLASIGKHRGTSAYCVGDRKYGTESVFDLTVQQRRFAHLINRFAEHYPTDWAFHHDLVRNGCPVGVVHLQVPLDDESAIARTILMHSVKRVQISDFPDLTVAG